MNKYNHPSKWETQKRGKNTHLRIFEKQHKIFDPQNSKYTTRAHVQIIKYNTIKLRREGEEGEIQREVRGETSFLQLTPLAPSCSCRGHVARLCRGRGMVAAGQVVARQPQGRERVVLEVVGSGGLVVEMRN